jgi:cardiolipin synthase
LHNETTVMKIIKYFFWFFLPVSILSLNYGCATLPNVSEMIDEAPTGQEPGQIVSSKGLLSPKKSKAIMERLKSSVNPTDIVERYTAVVESVTESPLTKGNKVTLLADGQATYAAMFKAMQNAKDHINLEMERCLPGTLRNPTKSNGISGRKGLYGKIKEGYAHLFSHWM